MEEPAPKTASEGELVRGEVSGDSRALWGQDRAALEWGPLRQERPQGLGPAFCLQKGPA